MNEISKNDSNRPTIVTKHGAYTCDCTMDEMVKICVKHMMEQDMGDGRKPMTVEEGLECVYRAFFPTLKRWRK